MYSISKERIIADWVKAKNRAKKRSHTVCKCCGIQWTQIYLSKLEPKQYKTTCSLDCTKKLQKLQGSKAFTKLWQDRDRDRMLDISSKAGRISASVTVKRSKAEIELYKLCFENFNNVFHNEILIDGWDADIIIKDFNIAVLWNGPWHYKQMPHKNHSLAQVQKRDEIKISKLTLLGYKVLSFEDRFYTPKSAFEEILKNVNSVAGECDGSTEGS